MELLPKIQMLALTVLAIASVGQATEQPKPIVAILHTKPLSNTEARDVVKNFKPDKAASYHLRSVEGKFFLVSREILPVEETRRAAQFFLELGKKTADGNVLFKTSDFGEDARRALLSNFTVNRPDGVSMDAKGEVAIQMMTDIVLKSGNKEVQISWRPTEQLPSNQIDLKPEANQDPGRIVKDSFSTRFPFEPTRYVLHNLTLPSLNLRVENAKLWGALFETVATEIDSLHKEYTESVSLCRSELVAKNGDPALRLENGRLSPKDTLALTEYLRANSKSLGFADDSEIDAFIAGLTVKSQRYLLEVTVKDRPTGYVTSGIDMGAAPR